MTINEFILKYRRITDLGVHNPSSGGGQLINTHNPRVICKDGFEMSVQAGQSLNSIPRDVADYYEQAEVGFPSTEETLLTPYADDKTNLCDTIYGYVPCSVIDAVLEKHGGIDERKIQDMKAKRHSL